MKFKILNLDSNFDIEILKNKLNLNEKHQTIFEQKQNSDFEDILKKEIINLQKDNDYKLIVISRNSALPFMFMSKHKDVVVADISDAHSAHMTMLHNNSNAISLSTSISTINSLKEIIQNYMNSYFEAGRHMVRINMLNKIIEKGNE